MCISLLNEIFQQLFVTSTPDVASTTKTKQSKTKQLALLGTLILPIKIIISRQVTITVLNHQNK